MPDERNKQGYFYIIPAILVENSSATKALLYGLITSLANKDGFCWASNSFLADKLGVKPTTISHYISDLEKGGWLHREVDPKEGNKRKIYITDKAEGQGGVVLSYNRSCSVSQEGSCSVSQQSNISNSNIKSNNGSEADQDTSKKKKQTGETSQDRNSVKYNQEDYDEILDAYQDIKGVDLNGPEYAPRQQTIKTMFMAGREPEQIISFMEWLDDSDEEWTNNWTLKTVKQKIPEFVAGELKGRKSKLWDF